MNKRPMRVFCNLDILLAEMALSATWTVTAPKCRSYDKHQNTNWPENDDSEACDSILQTGHVCEILRVRAPEWRCDDNRHKIRRERWFCGVWEYFSNYPFYES